MLRATLRSLFHADTPERHELHKRSFTLAVLAFALVVVLTSGMPLLNQARTETWLRAMSDAIGEHAREDHGAEASLGWEAVEMEGWLYSRRAHIKNLVLTTTNNRWLGYSDIVTFRAENAYLVQDQTLRGRVLLQFPEPVTIERNGQISQTLTFQQGVPVYSFVQFGDGGSQLAFSFPERTRITTGGREEAAAQPDTLAATLQLAEGSRAENNHNATTGERRATLDLRDLHYASAITNQAVDAAAFFISETRGKETESKRPFSMQITVRDGHVKNMAPLPEGPYQVAFSLEGEQGDTRHTATIKEASMHVGGTALAVTGQVVQEALDFLPSGTLNITLDNLDALPADARVKATLAALLQRITGEANAGTRAQFAIDRKAFGGLTIGRAAPQELLALLLTGVVPPNMLAPEVMTPPAPPPPPPPPPPSLKK